MEFKISSLRRRHQLGRYLNNLGLKGFAVELGTHKGIYARNFLNQWQGKKLYCVDPYISGYDIEDPVSRRKDRNADYEIAKGKLESHKDRIEFILETSEKALERFEDGSLDFVYEDAVHRYDEVIFNLRNWYPKIVTGGILAGHDIYSHQQPGKGYDRFIKPAVLDFANEIDLIPYRIRDPRSNWSYYFIKGENKE